MGMVFNYYALGTSDIDNILYELKDKLSTNGWTIDYDEIASNGKLAFHVTGTECYYTISKNPYYKDYLSGDYDARSHFHPYLISGNTGVDTGTWYSPELGNVWGAACDSYGQCSYFAIANSYCLVNNKFCVLILEGHTYHQPDYPYLMYYMFGQLEIPNETQQGNFLWVTPAYGDYKMCYEPGYQIRVRYKNTSISPGELMYDNSNSSYTCFWGLKYFTRSNTEANFPVENIATEYSDPYVNWDNPYLKVVPWLEKQPYQFGRLYLRTLIVYHKYEQDGVTYIHPIAETPFYICKYKGVEWYNKTIVYNTRKFKVYCMGYKGINYASEFGIAFEVGNL